MKAFRFILLFCILLASCVSEIQNSGDKQGSIVGIVRDKTTGEPVSTVSLTINPGGATTITGSDGFFTFEGLDAGSYSIDLEKEGYKRESASVVVFEGKQTESHLLIERLPAVITADRETLDFGDNEGVTQLSVSIVNPGYSDLHWSVSWDNQVKWIREVVGIDGRSEGTIAFGGTASLVVRIDRNELKAGTNEAVIVIWSDNGRSELKVLATGADLRVATTNILEVTDVDMTTAVFKGEVLSVGAPEYSERGFVYSTSSITADATTGFTTVAAQMNSDKQYSVSVSGLEIGTTYYVRAYGKNSVGLNLSSNQVSFTTIASLTKVGTKPVTQIDVVNGRAQFNGEIIEVGSPVYSEKGFCYNRNGEPTISDNKVTVSGVTGGDFLYTCASLSSNATYYVRAYAIQEGKVYYGTAVTFSTDVSTTIVSTSGATSVTPSSATLNGSIVQEGSPKYSEKGFCYSTTSNPTINSIKIVVNDNGVGNYSLSISGLSYNTTYYYKAYAIQNGIVVYGSQVSFNTGYTEAVVIADSGVTNIKYDSATISFTVTNVGDPSCTEAGICYGTSYNPSISSFVMKGVVGTYRQTLTVTGLNEGTTYYYRAFVIQNGQPLYSSVYSFNTASKPSVSTLSPSNLEDPYGLMNMWQVQLNGRVNSVGDPKINGRGFKYSSSGDPESAGTIVSASGSSAGDFAAMVTGLKSNTRYYVRAYVKNGLGYVYGDLVTFTTGN